MISFGRQVASIARQQYEKLKPNIIPKLNIISDVPSEPMEPQKHLFDADCNWSDEYEHLGNIKDSSKIENNTKIEDNVKNEVITKTNKPENKDILNNCEDEITPISKSERLTYYLCTRALSELMISDFRVDCSYSADWSDDYKKVTIYVKFSEGLLDILCDMGNFSNEVNDEEDFVKYSSNNPTFVEYMKKVFKTFGFLLDRCEIYDYKDFRYGMHGYDMKGLIMIDLSVIQ